MQKSSKVSLYLVTLLSVPAVTACGTDEPKAQTAPLFKNVDAQGSVLNATTSVDKKTAATILEKAAAKDRVTKITSFRAVTCS